MLWIIPGQHQNQHQAKAGLLSRNLAILGVEVALAPTTNTEAVAAGSSGKVMLSCWIPAAQRLELDRLWASQGLRPHGRTQQGMEAMIATPTSRASLSLARQLLAQFGIAHSALEVEEGEPGTD